MPARSQHIMHYLDSKSHRLPEYDYSQPGWYFVTLSTRNMSCLFGDVRNGVINLTDAGRMIERVWQELPSYSSRIGLDIFQVMPNHFHGILIIKADLERAPIASVGEKHKGFPQQQPATGAPLSLLDLIARFKSLTTTQYIRGVKENNWTRFDKKLWGTRFHDHVIRTESALQSIRSYIQNNPRKWDLDRLNK